MEKIETCNIWKSECFISLRDGSQLCPDCKGRGGIFLNVSFKQRNFTVQRCPVCVGKGKVDWIQAITKQLPVTNMGYPIRLKSKYIKMRCVGQQHCKKKLKRLWMDNKRFEKFLGPGGAINNEEIPR